MPRGTRNGFESKPCMGLKGLKRLSWYNDYMERDDSPFNIGSTQMRLEKVLINKVLIKVFIILTMRNLLKHQSMSSLSCLHLLCNAENTT